MSLKYITLAEPLEIEFNPDNIDSNISLSTQSFIHYNENDENSGYFLVDPNNCENKKDINNILNTLHSYENENNAFQKEKNEVQKEKNEKKQNIESVKSFDTVIKNVFQTEKKKSRGFQSNITRKKRHINVSFDNLLTKIQVHFLSFIINICNDALYSEFYFNNEYFKGISYDKKRYFNYQLFEEYKKSPIKNFLTFNISSKYKNFQPNHNFLLLFKVYNATEWLNKFFNMNYLKLFKYYFYYKKEKQMNKIYFEGKNIILSKNTKTFCDLLQKKENEGIKKELNDAAISVYFHD